jgi:cell wall-associated NlpC family hydrolase
MFRATTSFCNTLMPSNIDLVEAARTWLGVRWVHQGRSRTGVDCIGLIIVTAEECGLATEDMLGYRRTVEPERFMESIRRQTTPAADPEPGNIGIFRGGNQPCHVGIFAEKHGAVTLIHAYAPLGVVLEEPFIHQWPSNLIEIRKIEGML